ncbi:MAG: site-specific DNA-methyltransferase [Betaproteobacteria bacterium]|nr:site-specific DNA-methyltransferase [Betaproteobacteria bacterium]
MPVVAPSTVSSKLAPVRRITRSPRRAPAELQISSTLSVPVYEEELWTSRQRQASPIHEISYRACFKPQLPAYFIERLTAASDLVYDPFSGRGTTAVEAALQGRNVIVNDVNPLSVILTRPRLELPSVSDIDARLRSLKFAARPKSGLDLSMFFHPDTEYEILGLREYLYRRRKAGAEDSADRWIRMVATNRLTGHSPGFFSVYTLPPNQAVSPEDQQRINARLRQEPEYRDIRALIMKKTLQLQGRLSAAERWRLKAAATTARYLVGEAAVTPRIEPASVRLTVTSPPFLDVVQYARDNWLRCWFNGFDAEKIAQRITMSRSIEEWAAEMSAVFTELYRLTAPGGWVAFEVGEVRRGTIKLEEIVAPLGVMSGFECNAVLINAQRFTKTANIWGVRNNSLGTNSNRIVLFRKN